MSRTDYEPIEYDSSCYNSSVPVAVFVYNVASNSGWKSAPQIYIKRSKNGIKQL